MSTSSIRYTPLNTENAQIRLMIIEQTDSASDIICTLQTVPLEHANPFYALSYVWGNEDDMQTITLNGQRIKTRKNLYHFLQSLREVKVTREPLRVWVDYLCIDQSNLDERAAQVALMGQIYSTADSVYAWLGPATTDSEKAIDFLEQSQIQRSKGKAHLKIYARDSRVLHALEDLVRRPYWTRLWIIQEIVLAKRLWFFCGSRYISWDDLHFALAGTKGFGSGSDGRSNGLHDATKLLQHLKESRESPTAISLSKLVHKFIAAQCHDERDKIYGLLSLAQQDSRRLVVVDYHRPLLQLLLDTYPNWASEYLVDHDNVREESSVTNSYTPTLFCQELDLLFPETQLLNLYDDRELRRQITACVTFKGFWQSEVLEFRHIATIPKPDERFTPIGRLKKGGQDHLSRHTVSQMITPMENDIFTYTTIAPLPTDRIIKIGPMMLIIRQRGDESFIAGRGIQTRCSATESIFDPRIWRVQLLPDSLFELKVEHKPEGIPVRRLSARAKDEFVHVTLNAAALIEVLIAMKKQDCTWMPHDFGLRHRLIDMCQDCRLTVESGRRSSRMKACRCVWIGGEEPLSGRLRGLRRHSPVPV